MTQIENNAHLSVPVEEMKKQREYATLTKSILLARSPSKRPFAFVRTFGCQGNVADSERIKGMLIEMGYGLTETVEEADLAIFNTCAVREHAQDRVFGNVGALKPLKEKKPHLFIALCGCMMQQPHVTEKIKQSFSFVDLVFGVHVLHKLPEFLYLAMSKGQRMYEISQTDGLLAEGIKVHRDSTFKAWVPIMYGCDNYCSYCVVPYVRGREKSRKFEDVMEEVKGIIASGYKEITLLGQNVNSYGKNIDSDIDFSKLLESINSIEGDFLLRFMTSNPRDCSPKLLDTMAACEKVAKHLHLPFQSGNNRILKAMNRGYTREQYLAVVEYARRAMPDLSITSDVIVGFPGESYEEFCDTLSLVEQVRFTSLFTFIYSPREGTQAATMQDDVTREEKVNWFTQLTKMQEVIAGERTASMKGKTFSVLCESESKPGTGILTGRTQGNIIIEFPAALEEIGTYKDIYVTESKTWILKGIPTNYG